ncbi:hypothetical protein NPIL_35931 [Nephila pilipes]|uniref:Uncharacterized protein n=1 Tax=Nephila pilipes TaxID=299642 RepID=A0A8X6NI08_NEPPI|nr:hypothetical protein NPIL_35931 [Nephila pilipes]
MSCGVHFIGVIDNLAELARKLDDITKRRNARRGRRRTGWHAYYGSLMTGSSRDGFLGRITTEACLPYPVLVMKEERRRDLGIELE